MRCRFRSTDGRRHITSTASRSSMPCAEVGCSGSIAATLLRARPTIAAHLRDVDSGEAPYHAYQGQYFDAPERVDAKLAQHRHLEEPELDSLQHHIRQADFSVGDFELRYRMHLRAGRAIRAVL